MKKSSNARLNHLLESVLTQPTAPFRESWVKRACLSFCHQAKIQVHEDATGNLWLNARNDRDVRQSSLVFVAHMDHPGMVITGFQQKAGRIYATGKWLGGGPMDIRNFDVKVFSDVNALMVFDGVVRKHTKGRRGPEDVEIEIKSTPLARAACTPKGLSVLGLWGACLWYTKKRVPQGVVRRNGKWVTKAADDLVGACALMEGLKRARLPQGVVVLLSRAEESGFHGTLEVLRRRVLNPAKTMMVSIETSSELPGAQLGKGPVVRLGDRSTTFDPSFTFWVQKQAARLAKRDKSFQYQRRIMDGGTCEGTAFNVYGFKVAAISTPLAHYHNMSPSGRPEPEAVGVRDVEQLTQLITELMRAHRRNHIRELAKVAFAEYEKALNGNLKAHQKFFKGF